MRIGFVKCHGSGNDFALVDARGGDVAEGGWGGVARALSDRAGPVGSDGVLLLTAGDAAHTFGMRMFNSDGSESEQCLNGLRCVARAGFAATGVTQARVKLATSSAEVARADDLAAGVYTVRERAGPAGLDVADWPMAGAGVRVIDAAIAALPGGRAFTAVAMPNPHLVSFVEAIDEEALVAIGRACEAAPDWLPNRANVSFVRTIDASTLFVRTFERGVGLTDACGSAMAASAYAAGLTGRVAFGTAITVRNPGGLVTARADADGMVTLSGNATWEWEGSAEIDVAAGRATAIEVTRRYPEEIEAWARVRARARGGVEER